MQKNDHRHHFNCPQKKNKYMKSEDVNTRSHEAA